MHGSHFECLTIFALKPYFMIERNYDSYDTNKGTVTLVQLHC